METTEKRCCTCRVYKPLGEFYRNHKSNDGHAWQCKECQSHNNYGAKMFRLDERIDVIVRLDAERIRLVNEGNYVGLRRLAAEYRRMNMPQAAAELMR